MNIVLHGQNILPDLTNKDFERGEIITDCLCGSSAMDETKHGIWKSEKKKERKEAFLTKAPPAAAGFTDGEIIINKECRQPVDAGKDKTRKQLPQSLLKGSHSCRHCFIS